MVTKLYPILLAFTRGGALLPSSPYGREVYILLLSRREHQLTSDGDTVQIQLHGLSFLLSPLFLGTLGRFDTSSSFRCNPVGIGDPEGLDYAPNVPQTASQRVF